MNYRELVKGQKKTSILGFGCMRLPEKNGEIDKGLASYILDYALENGVNYFDTGWEYHNYESEKFLGEYLSFGRRRDKVSVATKMPVWEIKTLKDMDYYLFSQLSNLKANRFDYYMLHSMTGLFWENLKEAGIAQWLDEKLKSGLIGSIGFSFHDDIDSFKKIINEYDKWSFCQIQYNYIDENYQAGRQGLEFARSKGLGVIVMEPLLGGSLANLPPRAYRAWKHGSRSLFGRNPIKAISPVDLSFRWLWSQDISMLLSGMNSLEQVKQNIDFANKFCEDNSINKQEAALVHDIKQKIEKSGAIPCTNCKYCVASCPNNIDISSCFYTYNLGAVFNQNQKAKEIYRSLNINASACNSCNACIEKCPQKIQISKELDKVNRYFKKEQQ